VFQVFDAISFALAYLIGAAICLNHIRLAAVDPVWRGSRFMRLLTRWTIKTFRGRLASGSFGMRGLRWTGRVGRTSYRATSIRSKMSPIHDRKLNMAKGQFEKGARHLSKKGKMRIFTIMDYLSGQLERFVNPFGSIG